MKRWIQRYDVAVPLMTRVDEDVLEGDKKGGGGGGKLKLVLQFGVGLEGVSIDAATRRDVKVGRIRSDKTPNAQSTAEMGVFLTLAALKRANECRTSVLRRTLGAPMGDSLFGAHVLKKEEKEREKKTTRRRKKRNLRHAARRRRHREFVRKNGEDNRRVRCKNSQREKRNRKRRVRVHRGLNELCVV